jgi:hypothetical protein
MPYGNLNVDTVTTSTTGGVLGAGNASIMKNRLINGDMRIDQRNAGASVTPAANALTYNLDRWAIYPTQASKLTVQQNAGAITAPVGFNNYLGIVSSSAYSVVSGDSFTLRQYIEGYNFADLGFGTANAKTVTLSFQVYSSLTGTFGGSLNNYAFTRSYPFSYTVSAANTWTTISVTIAGDTGGTWVGSSNAGSAAICFNLGIGSTYQGTANTWASAAYLAPTGAVSVVGTNGATFYITGVQLEVGSSATGFEYRQYGQELNLCQRYFLRQNIDSGYLGMVDTSTSALCYVPLPQTMRTAPSFSYSGSFELRRSGIAASAVSAIVGANATADILRLNVTSSSLTAGQVVILSASSGSPYTMFSSEL